MKDKEQALEDFISMIVKSWTYDRFTKEEKTRCMNLFYELDALGQIKGSYKDRWNILQAIYRGFLVGLDYNPINWRSNNE